MKKLIALAIVPASLIGCSTIINEKTQNVNVQTPNGQKMEVRVDGQTFKAPGVIPLVRRNENKNLEALSPDCKGTTVAEKSVDPIFFINILSGGVFGSTTDYSSEKMWKYSENITINCSK